jgi:hypothetical protein
MKYIPGTTILVANLPLKGSIKGFFEPGKSYYLKNVRKLSENEIEYTFVGSSSEFTIRQPNFVSGDTIIDYLITGRVIQQQSYWDNEERKD